MAIDFGKTSFVLGLLGSPLFAQGLAFQDSTAVLEKTSIQSKKEVPVFVRSVEGTTVFEGKKTDLVILEDQVANTATNNARQIFAKVPGITVWESDGAGIQMGIGSRGLSPSRSAEFNMRQNGYDMSADALGYPESYYNPPMEAVEKVEILRGAASLQFGTQFGGLVNFVTRKPSAGDSLEIISRQTLGNWNFFNSFNSVSSPWETGAAYAYVQYKKGDDFRDFAEFDQQGAHLYLLQEFDQVSVSAEFTHMNYLAQQPGGLTDLQFEEDPLESLRERNWFSVLWNLFALKSEYKPNFTHTIDFRFFGLQAHRYALGNLEAPHRADIGDERDLLKDDYLNFGLEARHLIRYSLFDGSAAFLYGLRLYRGSLERRQGLGSEGSDADFEFLNEGQLEGSDYHFPSYNGSFFIENIIPVNSQWKFTPGLRVESILTEGDGYYSRRSLHPLTGEVLEEEQKKEVLSKDRFFVLGAIGTSYWVGEPLEIYSNFSQNYRAINFNDLRVNSPNVRVDTELKDEKGFTFDLGLRGSWNRFFRYDLSGFWLEYGDRIGQVLRADEETYRTYRFRTNISDSRHLGVESFVEFDLWRFLHDASQNKLALFNNLTYLRARYVNSAERAIEGNRVELVPEIQWRIGLQWLWEDFGGSVLYSYTGEQYSEATNADFTPDGVNGLIPSYQTVDLSLKYQWDWLLLETGCNNLLDHRYFSRRSTGYPGPGIITAPPRSIYGTFGLKF